jgi:signal transduction histidine kinase
MKKIITIAEKEILKSVRRLILSGSDISDIIKNIFIELRKVIPCDRLDIALIEESGHRIEICITHANYKPLYLNKGYIEDIENNISLICNSFLTGKFCLIKDIKSYKMTHEKSGLIDLLLKEKIHSIIIIPVIAGNKSEGILLCALKRKNSITEYHAQILRKTAKELSRIILNIRQQSLIEQNHQAYMEMLSFVSHELRSPISSIITMARTVVEGYYGKMEEKQRDVLKRVIKKAEYLDAVSNQYLNLSRFESNKMKLRPLLIDFIEDIVDSAIELLMPQIEERNIKFERDFSETVFPVVCDPDMMKIVMLNLLNNGIKYGNKNGILKISIIKSYKKIKVSVWNEGPGFPESGKRFLFRKFSRLESGELLKQKGSGVGLYLSWKIIQLHGGRITADSKEGAWAEFTFELAQHMDFRINE